METTVTIARKTTSGRISRHVQFALCSSCFWCASYLDGRGTEKCPSCSGAIESTPVAGNEMYTFDYDLRRGVTVDFVPVKASA
jgi:hypothetical protein